MKTTDIIRTVLDILDQSQIEEPKQSTDSRFKQILSMLQNRDNQSPLANSPNEVVAPIEAVTTDAGGGVNGPKHPDDIRVKDPRGY